MLTITTITKIFSKIALSHKAVPYRRINTVARITSWSDFSDPQLGKSYKDVEEGTYWRRNPLIRNDLKKQEGILAIMPVSQSWTDLSSSAKTKKVMVMAAFPIECPTCPTSDKPTSDQVDDMLQDILMSFISRFGEYQEIKINQAGTPSVIFEHLQMFETIDGTIQESYGSIYDQGIIDRKTFWSLKMHGPIGTEGYRIASTELDIMSCEVTKQEFDVNQTQGDNVGRIVAACNSCL